MKALDIEKHKIALTNILIDIYKNDVLSPILGFKGGTAAMLFYDLPRFSVDLDFDLLPSYKKDSKEIDKVVDIMTNLLSSKYKVLDSSLKFNTLFWMVSYGSNLSHVKVEISTRDSTYNTYELKDYYGFDFKVMGVGDMIAHKMVALTERTIIANRDLFDIHYFLTSKYATSINFEVIKKRTGKDPKEFFEFLLKYVTKIKPSAVLNGLGEVLTDSQKDWAKAKLLKETIGLIEMRVDSPLEVIPIV